MEKLGQTSIAVYGGVNGSTLLRDFTIFDINQNKWIEVHPFNGPLHFINQPQMLFNFHSAFIMGGFS